ncbi:putative 4-hydroxybenzoate polyprenyltransferase [Fusibacter paucivorans]|uniref:4-hydroxybenzoate polyprenyltransferase n=1 Tax=Fusibacter paucivorans TaxID=76009 RepID=A0ABS5PN62_9FIRM|nr:UbiA-like polyprenyltransferase [Fusibacter paucivorans]MBS7526503.1 putative 4-hydroxybenzoate polyprenyltransferase [Fusibacter paucivorans]
MVYKGVLERLHRYGELVMFSHTLFSLPFAMIAMFLAAEGLPNAKTLLWILVALFAGRNGANALNRYVDARFDALNPRTADRHIPSGSVKPREALLLTVIAYVIFVFAAAKLNPICLYLSPVALLLFTLYSYTKRFTWLCHQILGITCAGAPVGAWLAVTGHFALTPLILAAVVTLWISGFDILYGTQDIDFDRAQGLYSIPARFGLKGALSIARISHFIMWLLLLLLTFQSPLLSMPTRFGVLCSGILLIVEHLSVDPAHRQKMNFASYHLNQIISVILFISVTLDIFIL